MIRRTVSFMSICLVLLNSLAAQNVESILIGPGDTLHVEVFETPDLNQTGRVSDAGDFSLILGGDVKIAGLTTAQAALVIEKDLQEKQLLRKPRVSVSILDFATQRVSVLGEVQRPGAIVIDTPRSILDVLALAGGLTSLADRKILIERHGSDKRIAYFVSNEADEAIAKAVMIYPGDTIIVPKASIAYIIGDVGAPGGYTMTDDQGTLTVLELVARAGGANKTSVAAHARLIRRTNNGYIEFQVNIKSIEKGKQSDFALQPNDIVFLPFSFLKNFATSVQGVVSSIGTATIYRY